MKLWQVYFETDGQTVKAPGVAVTERKRESYLYLAERPETVWDEIAQRRSDPNFEFISLAQLASSVTALDEVICSNCDCTMPRGCEGIFKGQEGCLLTPQVEKP